MKITTLEPWASKPWVKNDTWDNDLYRYEMTQAVLDNLDFADGFAVLEGIPIGWVGPKHIRYAAGVIGMPIEVKLGMGGHIYLPVDYPDGGS